MTAEEIAAATGAEIIAAGEREPALRAIVDSREARAGDLFFGLPGANADGGDFAAAALAAGAWGTVTDSEHVPATAGWTFAVADPLAAMQALAREWRRRLGARTVGITGSVGKTSVKDIARVLLPGRVHANRENLNTEIGLPLTVLEAAPGTETLVLEMAMRGPGQIAELAAIAEPEVGVVTNVGPVHVGLLGSVEAIAAAKAELIAALPAGGTAIVPADPGALAPHLGAAPRLLRFGAGGEVRAATVRVQGGVTEALVETPIGEERFYFPFTEPHNVLNSLAAIAVGVTLGTAPAELADRAPDIGFSRFRGERLELGDGIVLVNDCYNANPVSMRAALDHIAADADGRTIAVLGEMAELGERSGEFHREVGEHARSLGIDRLLGVGAPARDYGPDELVADPAEAAHVLAQWLEPEDMVLVKGSRSAGLEAVAETLRSLIPVRPVDHG